MLQIFSLSIILPLILILLNSLLAKKENQQREKLSAFECGFDPKSKSRTPFSLRFFLVALIFLIFDIEIALILPVPIILNTINLNICSNLMFTFIMILITGLLMEWKKGALEWK